MLIELLKTYDADIAADLAKENPTLAEVTKVWEKTSKNKAGDIFTIDNTTGQLLHDNGYARERRKVEFISALEHKGVRYEIGKSRDFDVDLARALVESKVAKFAK